MTDIYWRGPHGVYVPCGIQGVPAADDFNRCARDGFQTCMGQLGGPPPPTAKQYRRRYAVRRWGRWFYDVRRLSAEQQNAAFVFPDEIDTAFYRVTSKSCRRLNEHPLFERLKRGLPERGTDDETA